MTALLFICGFGRISTTRLQKQDQEKPPYKQKLGFMYINQASRAKMRVELLETFGPKRDIPKWSLLAAQVLGQADRLWKDHYVSADLKVGQAVMLAKAGLTDDAYDMLKNLASKIAPETKLSYYYHRGDIGLQLGLAEEWIKDWEEILKHALNEKFDILLIATKYVTDIADSHSLEMTEEIWRKKIKKAAGLSNENAYFYRAVVNGFKENNISSPFLIKFEEKFGKLTYKNEPLPSPENKPLVERIEE